jgi:hypothetical protein
VLVASLLSDPEDGDVFLQNISCHVLGRFTVQKIDFFMVASLKTTNSVY